MIVGCYTLALYCDNKEGAHEYREFPHEFTNEFGTVCRANARRAGWKLDTKTGRAWCPKCANESRGK